MSKKNYDVAAFIWPSYTGDEPRTRIFWPEGYGEWETVKAATAKKPGHTWPRKPLWGYVNEADPYVMEMEIEAAVDHGINVFIYDWYWYDNRPFLEQCLNNGFLKAKNNHKMKFYLMWANHDANYLWDRRISTQDGGAVIWQGAVNREQFETLAKRITENYFTKPNYYTIDGKPVFMLYDIDNLIKGLGSIEKVADALNWWREEVKKYGLKGVHFQGKSSFKDAWITRSEDPAVAEMSDKELVKALTYDSITNYNMFALAPLWGRDYGVAADEAAEKWGEQGDRYGITYFPHVSVGWDTNPRFKETLPDICVNNTPEEIKKIFQKVKAYLDEHDEHVPLVTVNSWNEWTETSYLQPDDIYGYGYLEAIKSVFVD